MLSVNRSLNGKRILITGATGFVGKVLVEKILRDCPEIGKIYLLIRGKAEQRVVKEIFNSKIFIRLRSARDDFDHFAREKVKAVSGDVLMDNMGMSPQDLALLQSEVDVVVHCAATVDFRERLDSAIKKNVLGTIGLFEVSKTFKHLEAFIHVSTAYVNADRQGFHTEDLPPLNVDPEEIVHQILQIDPADIERQTPGIIGNYPNTYTFTKAIAERLLEKRKGNIPVSYVRPTIIGAAWKEPVPGWIDSVSAIAAVILYTGVGLVRFIQGDMNLICDIVPVDTVCNIILAAIPATIGKRDKLQIFHVGTSQLNPVRWIEAARWVSTYWRQHNVKRRVDQTPLKFRFYKTKAAYRTQFFLRNELPSTLYSLFANTIGTEQHRKNADMLKKITSRTLMVTGTFVHFTSTEFIFDVKNSETIWKSLVPEEQAKYDFGLQELDWEKYYRFFCYGMQRYVLHEEVKPPTELLKIDLVNEPRKMDPSKANVLMSKLFPDLTWAYKNYKSNIGIDNFMTLRTPDETKALILKSRRVQDAIKQVADSYKNVSISDVESQAFDILDRMAHTLRMPIVRALGYFLRKVWRRIYRGIHVEEKGIEEVKKVLANGPMIVIPTHRSYVDFLIVSYIFFEYDLPLPHIAAGEDFLGIAFVNWVFRNSGAFFLRRSFKGDILYTAIFTEYVQRLICDWSPVEFFIEGKRSRAGKTLHPKFGLLSICMDPFITKKVPDTTIIPVSISYEKVIEAEVYSNELLGEPKPKESLDGLIRASRILRLNFGRINVIFNTPISAKEFTQELSTQINSFDPYKKEDDRRTLMQELAYKVTYDLNKGLVITSTAIVATIVLTYRKGITRQDLILKVDWLREEINARGGTVAFEGTTEDLIDQALKLLRNNIKKPRNMYIPAEDKRVNNLLILDFYRNQLLHLFTPDCLVACVLSASLASKDGIAKDDLIKEAHFLSKLLRLEFVNKPSPRMEDNFEVVVSGLLERGSLSMNKDMVAITAKGEGHITFLCHLYWPLIDAYWVAALTLFSLQPNLSVPRKPLLQKMSWVAEKMHNEGKVSFFESCSMEILSNALELFNNWNVIELNEVITKATVPQRGAKKDKKKLKGPPEEYIVSLKSPYQQESPLQEFVEKINRFRKLPPNYLSKKQKLVGFRRSVMADYPILAKL